MLAHDAVEYLRAGFHILALHHKRPNGRWHETWDYDNSIHGLPETKDEYEQLGAIFNHSSTTGIAVLIPPNVLVADIDSEEAAALYMELAGELPQTPTAQTKNGLHVWFLAPGADQTAWLGARTLLFKGLGGYVAAPPSRHFDEAGVEDGVYTWINPLIEDGRVVGMDWLPETMMERIRSNQRMAELRRPDLREETERWYIEVEYHDAGWRLWKRWDIAGLCRAIAEAPEGNQNNMIAWAAMQARDEGVPLEVAMEHLLAAAIAGKHPADRARTTIIGAYRRKRRDS